MLLDLILYVKLELQISVNVSLKLQSMVPPIVFNRNTVKEICVFQSQQTSKEVQHCLYNNNQGIVDQAVLIQSQMK